MNKNYVFIFKNKSNKVAIGLNGCSKEKRDKYVKDMNNLGWEIFSEKVI